MGVLGQMSSPAAPGAVVVVVALLSCPGNPRLVRLEEFGASPLLLCRASSAVLAAGVLDSVPRDFYVLGEGTDFPSSRRPQPARTTPDSEDWYDQKGENEPQSLHIIRI